MKKTIIIITLILLIAPLVAFAQAQAVNPCSIAGGVAPNSLPRCINQIYIWSLGVGSLLALLMIIIGGYYYMTAAGNAERSSTGTEMIWSSIIGLALLFGAYLLLNTINPDLVNFQNFTNDIQQLNPNQQPTAPRTN